MGTEPKTRQLVTWAAGRLAKAIAVLRAIVLDRRIEPIAHVLQVALEGGTRDGERLFQFRERYRAAGPEQLLDLIKAFGTVHAKLPYRMLPSMCWPIIRPMAVQTMSSSSAASARTPTRAVEPGCGAGI